MGRVITLALFSPLLAGALLLVPMGANSRRRAVLLGYGVALGALVGANGSEGLWRIDGPGRFLALVTVVIGGYVALFGCRQWGPPLRDRAALGCGGLIVTSVLSSDLAARLDTLVASFVLTSVATLLLLVLSARSTGRSRGRTAIGLLLGDLILVASVLVSARTDALLGPRVHPLAGGVVLFIGASLAALGRAGAGSSRSWVLDTVNHPTAVSALLHAGVVNGGAILLVRLSPLTGVSRIEWDLLAAACVAQLVWWAPVIRRRADLKGQLAASTVSQMTFMMLALALGWPLLALTHLAGHALYKSTRFMNAAGSIRRRSRTPHPVVSAHSPGLFDLALGVLLVGAALLSAHVGGSDAAALQGVLLPAALALVWSVRRRSSRAGALVALVSSAVVIGYGALVGELQRSLTPGLDPGLPSTPWWTLGALTLAVVALSRRNSPRVRSVDETVPTHVLESVGAR